MKINIENLKKSFGTNVAVDIEEFTISHGDMLGIVGNNGAGKTTLFRMMLDLLKADTGKVTLTPDSEDSLMIDPSQSEQWKAFTGAYIDNSFLIDFLTAEEYFEFVGHVSNMDKEQTKRRITEFEDFFNGEILGQKKYIRDLSAGNKQKVGIAAALFGSPQLVILDEPFNFLDPSSQNMLKKTLVKYNRDTNATILISSHNLQHTVEISSRVALLERGRIIKNLDNSEGRAANELDNYFSGSL